MSQSKNERTIADETFTSPVTPEEFGLVSERARQSPWPKRFLARIKQGERFQACAYFLSIIL